MVSKRESLSNRGDRYVVTLLRQFFAASLLSCRKSGIITGRRSLAMPHPRVGPCRCSLTILPIDTNGYTPSQNAAADPRERRALNSTITARPMARDDVGWIMPENDC